MLWDTINAYISLLRTGVSGAVSKDVPYQNVLPADLDVITIPKPAGSGCTFRTLSVDFEPVPDIKEARDFSPISNPIESKTSIFSFGPDGAFFYANSAGPPSPPGIGSFSYAGKSTWVNPNIADMAHVYWYTFTPFGGQCVAWKDKHSRLSQWTHHTPLPRTTPGYASALTPPDMPTYNSLFRWVRKNVSQDEQSYSNISLTFGPGASYFAKSATSCTWHDLPDELDTFLTNRDAMGSPLGIAETSSIPQHVALGANSDYVIFMQNDDRHWSLNREHFLLPKIKHLADPRPNTWDEVALNPENSEDFFLATRSGSIDMTFNAISTDAACGLASVFVQYMQGRALQDHRKFGVSVTIGDQSVNVDIGPSSKWALLAVV